MSDPTNPGSPWPTNVFPTPGGTDSPVLWPHDPFDVTTPPPAPPSRPTPPRSARDEGRGDLRVLARGGILNFASIIASAVLNVVLVVIVTRGFGTSMAGVFFE
ncbi:MAG: hypothetical protein ABR518_07905, partial [Actinomycetota bacterium]